VFIEFEADRGALRSMGSSVQDIEIKALSVNLFTRYNLADLLRHRGSGSSIYGKTVTRLVGKDFRWGDQLHACKVEMP